MALELIPCEGGKLLMLHVSGKLHKDDYTRFVPEIEQSLEKNGKLRILMEMRDFHGWDVGALWQDIKFDVKHFSDIERVAMVGDQRWEQWMAIFCKPFTTAKIKYFPAGQEVEARTWVMSN